MSTQTHPAEVLAFPLDGLVLRRCRVDDAKAIADAVARNLDHLRPWMPWAADDTSARPAFQRDRLHSLDASWGEGSEFGYVLVDPADGRVVSTTSLMTRRGPGTLEVGYWTDVDSGGRGYAREIARALTDAAFTVAGVERVAIHCDEANVRSAAVPRRLGFTLAAVTDDEPVAPSESGRSMQWVMERADWRADD